MKWFALGLVAGWVLGSVYPVRAHEDADWIRMHPDFSWCCSEHDCGVYPAEKVHVSDRGYVIEDGEVIPYEDAKPSNDGRYWRCVRPGGTRCFFAPPSGS